MTVAAEDDVELRRVTITNRSLRSRQLEFTSYLELALAPHRTDAAHPAFAKMFVETECPESGVLLRAGAARGRPDDPPIWAAHVLTGRDGRRFSTKRIAPRFWAAAENVPQPRGAAPRSHRIGGRGARSDLQLCAAV